MTDIKLLHFTINLSILLNLKYIFIFKYTNLKHVKIYDFFQLIMFLVTDDGIYYLHLMHSYFGTQGAFHLWIAGDFHGLEILEADSEYQVLLTTRRTRSCCFLELRGSKSFLYE